MPVYNSPLIIIYFLLIKFFFDSLIYIFNALTLVILLSLPPLALAPSLKFPFLSYL